MMRSAARCLVGVHRARAVPALARAAAAPLRRPVLSRTLARSMPAAYRCMGTVIDATVVEKGDKASGETHAFQAETKQLLDIVTNSLYTDRHIFIRELISNASDALEKARHLQVSGEAASSSAELGIHITTDKEARTITISDTGVGFTKDELIDHLGTIARSGSKAFLKEMAESGKAGDLDSNIIGQFGVGFYSAFMVGDTVDVYTQSNRAGVDDGFRWSSAGDGEFTVDDWSGASRGSKIVVNLKDDALEFCDAEQVEQIIKTHSYFVPFPIHLNGKQINTVQAVWAMPKSDITEDMYLGFYKHVSKAFDKPQYRLHFSTDAPIDIKALFYVGEQSREKFGTGIVPPGTSLYSHKVLIEPESKILPQWLRFVFGVVDSEDIPLNISRESMQDSALLNKIKNVLTRRFLRFLDQESRKDPEKYNSFFRQFGMYLKEGICMDQPFQEDLAKLIRFESSAMDKGELTSLDEYISRCEPSQSSIYYLVAPNREVAMASPYMEAFRGRKGTKDTEVLFMYQNPIDDFVMTNLGTYNTRKLVTAEVGSIDVAQDGATSVNPEAAAEEAEDEDAGRKLDVAQVKVLSDWLMDVALPGKLSEVKVTSRLRESPAVITDHESAAMRRMFNLVQQSQEGQDVSMPEVSLPKQKLELNPSHPIILGLNQARKNNPPLAIKVAEQIFDNALTAAGLMDDPRVMLPRLNALLEVLATQASLVPSAPPVVDDSSDSSSSDSDGSGSGSGSSDSSDSSDDESKR